MKEFWTCPVPVIFKYFFNLLMLVFFFFSRIDNIHRKWAQNAENRVKKGQIEAEIEQCQSDRFFGDTVKIFKSLSIIKGNVKAFISGFNWPILVRFSVLLWSNLQAVSKNSKILAPGAKSSAKKSSKVNKVLNFATELQKIAENRVKNGYRERKIEGTKIKILNIYF